MKKYIHTALFIAVLFFALPHTPQAFAAVAGDVNGDGVANGEDLGLVLGGWGPCTPEGACDYDLNGDKEVNQMDVDLVQKAWTNKPVVPQTTQGVTKKTSDLNGDGKVGAEDLSILLGAWGKCPVNNVCSADLNSDSIVGKADQNILLASWSSKSKPAFSATEKARIRSTSNMLSTSNVGGKKVQRVITADDTREKTNRGVALGQYVSAIKERLTLGATRINTLIERMNSRIEKLKAEGVDTTTSRSFVDKAKTELELARTQIANIPTSFTEINKESIAKVRGAIMGAKEHLEAARKNLVSAISNLKPGINKTETNTSAGASSEAN